MEILIVVTLTVVAIWFGLHRSGNPQFWRAVRQNPELAIAWFEQEDCWVIVHPGQPAPRRDRYTIGLAAFDPASGAMVKVHCLADRIDDSQTRFMSTLESSRS